MFRCLIDNTGRIINSIQNNMALVQLPVVLRYMLLYTVLYSYPLCMSYSTDGTVFRRGACPCTNPAWCEPIKTISKHELFVFSTNGPSWRDYAWDDVTTVAVQEGFDPQMMCHAHSKGVRIVVWGSFTNQTLFNDTASQAWIDQVVKHAVGNFTDGYNLDFEYPLIAAHAPVLTAMVRRVRDAFNKALPYSQISFDTPSSPVCQAGSRCFDYVAMGEFVDFFMIMAYDELNYTSTVAGANDPLKRTTQGVDDFIKVGVPANKLVLGVPWYAYDYPCVNLTETNECIFEHREHHSWEQRAYGDIMKLLANNSTTGRLWNSTSECPYFNYKTESTPAIHQVWYDDPTSLEMRFSLVRDRQLYGAAVFQADCLDYSQQKQAVIETREMWDTFIHTFS